MPVNGTVPVNVLQVKGGVDETAGFIGENIDAIQTGLDLAGTVPVVGEPVDLVNGGIYLIRGDTTNAILSGGSAIPFVGWGFSGAKLTKKTINVAEEAGTLISKGAAKGIDARVLEAMKNSNYKKYPGIDCSEIAEDLYNAAGKNGKI